ncbi:NAD(+)/NADH kinase [Streptomyces sp. ISL-12]|uniref:diacylglycerol/lipid kinase family protein n=1 Tax=Streptomyces sp. ISL-12 TaxID=2819177 RepID=UPI001BE536AB|nr:diacylglycerol kinase family protein [Streptomyces sp. ISL-12]MBT2413964.1 NAD(+)/NADH kinase [Streptomyces sp. ISL-12]
MSKVVPSDGARDQARARSSARHALLAAAAAVVVVLLSLGDGGSLVILGALAGLAVCAVGAWWFLAHRGALRVLGAVLAVAAPVAVLVLFLSGGMWFTALAAVLLWVLALTRARAALRAEHRPDPAPAAVRPHPPHRRAVLIMNPASGGGKVERFGLVERAEALGARVVLLTPGTRTDVAELARNAVAEGADLLGVAGGDGTQALVAAVAAEHDLPFLVISAGTRNHLAMDLGLDRDDPSRCLDALTDGVEFRVDLGDVAGRAFVNTVSFGVYAEIVRRPEYRDAKAGTALDALPDLLAGGAGERLDARADDRPVDGQQALLVSNNPYATADPLDVGRRPRLDRGELGVLGIRVDGPAQAADLAVRGTLSPALTVLTSRRVEVTAADTAESIPVAVDGEALTLPAPVVCTVRPRALRVLVPRDRPGAEPPPPPLDWRRVTALALGRP